MIIAYVLPLDSVIPVWEKIENCLNVYVILDIMKMKKELVKNVHLLAEPVPVKIYA